jgi:carboxyl-terminal processing protease
MNTALRFFSGAGILLLSFCTAHSQPNLKEQAFVLKRMIELNHVSPRPVDDRFSEDFFNQFMDALDGDGLYFTQSDMDALSQFKTILDDELQGKGWHFFNTVLSLYKRRLHEADSIIHQVSQKPFDFTIADQIPAGFENQRARTGADLKSRWNKLLKYEVLSGLAPVAIQQLSKDGAIRKNEVWQKEAAVRSKMKSRYQQKIQSLLKDNELEPKCTELYLTSLAACFDPHTAYFDMSAKKGFQTDLNTEGYYYGFGLKDNERSEVVISGLMPGSPAWKSGQLNKDDVLLELQWEGQEPVDVSISSAEEVDALIDESKLNKLSLTVRKANGQVAIVFLQKEKVENEQQFFTPSTKSSAQPAFATACAGWKWAG